MNKKELSEEERIDREKHAPVFFLIYNIVVMISIIFLFVILFIVNNKAKKNNDDIMLSAVLIIQLAGLGYILPFYFLPEIICITKYKKNRKANITLLSITTAFFALFYIIFKLILLIIK